MADPTPPEAPKPETDFEMWWASTNDAVRGFMGKAMAKTAWQAAHTVLSARLADLEKQWERDEAKRNLEWQTLFMNQARRKAAGAETALATAQVQLAQALPCDVMLSGIVIRAGCKISTLLEALQRRIDKARAAGKGTES